MGRLFAGGSLFVSVVVFYFVRIAVDLRLLGVIVVVCFVGWVAGVTMCFVGLVCLEWYSLVLLNVFGLIDGLFDFGFVFVVCIGFSVFVLLRCFVFLLLSLFVILVDSVVSIVFIMHVPLCYLLLFVCLCLFVVLLWGFYLFTVLIVCFRCLCVGGWRCVFNFWLKVCLCVCCVLFGWVLFLCF